MGELKQQRSQTGTTLSIRNGRKGVGGIATLGCTGGVLGERSWGHLGDSLGACWGGLGAGLVRLGASWWAWDSQSSPFSSGNCVCQEGAIPENETPRANDQEKAEGLANQQARRGPARCSYLPGEPGLFPLPSLAPSVEHSRALPVGERHRMGRTGCVGMHATRLCRWCLGAGVWRLACACMPLYNGSSRHPTARG